MEIHLDCTPKTTKLFSSNGSIILSYLQICSNVKKPSKKVILLTPFTVSRKRFLYLATALALDYNDVILIQSNNIVKQINAKKIELQNIAPILMSTFSPDAIIACDVFYPIFLSEIEQNSLTRFVFLRPILFLNQFNLRYYIPLSIPWFYFLFLRINQLPSLLHTDAKQLLSQKFLRNQANVLNILPKHLLWEIFKKNLLTNQSNIAFSKPTFSFRDYETIVYGKIQNFITGVSSAQ